MKIQNPKLRRNSPKPTCGNCRYFVKEGEGGFCYREPPKVTIKPDGTVQGTRPPAKLDWWCGEWKVETNS